MSKVAIEGNASGTGTFTIAAPNSNSNYTITLPAASGTMATTETAGFPSGTVMLFVQTAAPTGWTKGTTHDNKALRVVSGTASSGGSVAFTTAFASGLSAGATTLSTSQIPSHSHTYYTKSQPFGWGSLDGGASDGNGANARTTTSAGSGGSHNHSLPSFDVQYVDVIIATKD